MSGGGAHGGMGKKKGVGRERSLRFHLLFGFLGKRKSLKVFRGKLVYCYLIRCFFFFFFIITCLGVTLINLEIFFNYYKQRC